LTYRSGGQRRECPATPFSRRTATTSARAASLFSRSGDAAAVLVQAREGIVGEEAVLPAGVHRSGSARDGPLQQVYARSGSAMARLCERGSQEIHTMLCCQLFGRAMM
jgi:hypothetical protein